MNHVTVDFKQNWTFVLLVQPRRVEPKKPRKLKRAKKPRRAKKPKKAKKPKNIRSSSQIEDQVFELFIRSSTVDFLFSEIQGTKEK